MLQQPFFKTALCNASSMRWLIVSRFYVQISLEDIVLHPCLCDPMEGHKAYEH